jgi:hypothetical protein
MAKNSCYLAITQISSIRDRCRSSPLTTHSIHPGAQNNYAKPVASAIRIAGRIGGMDSPKPVRSLSFLDVIVRRFFTLLPLVIFADVGLRVAFLVGISGFTGMPFFGRVFRGRCGHVGVITHKSDYGEDELEDGLLVPVDPPDELLLRLFERLCE